MAEKHDLNCPHCQTSMIKSYENEAKFRMKLIVWNAEGMFAVCKSCSHEVSIDVDIFKSIQSSFVYEIEK